MYLTDREQLEAEFQGKTGARFLFFLEQEGFEHERAPGQPYDESFHNAQKIHFTGAFVYFVQPLRVNNS